MMGRKNLFWGIMAGAVLSIGFFVILFLCLPQSISAVDVNMEVGGQIGYGSASLLEVVLNVVRWALGLLALVAVIFIIYGGYLWMTAHGNEEQVMKAKRVLRDAVIGIVIVLLSWAIVTYVIGVIGNASNDGTGSGCDQPGWCVYCRIRCDASGHLVADPTCDDASLCAVLGGANFQVKWTQPKHLEANVTICTVIQAGFNDNVDPASLDDITYDTFKLTDEDGNVVPGDYTVVEAVVDFAPDSDLLPNTLYTLSINGVTSTPDGDLVEPKTIQFTTGTEEDTIPPIVLYSDDPTKDDFTAPVHGQTDVCTNTDVAVVFSEPMRVITIHDGDSDVNPSISLTNVSADPDQPLTYRNSISFPDAQSFIAKPKVLPLASDTDFVAYLRGGDDPYAITDVCGNPLDGEGGPVTPDLPDGDSEDPSIDKYEWLFTTGQNAECTPVIDSINPTQGYYSEAEVTITGRYLGITGDVMFKNRVYNNQNCFNDISGNHYPVDNCVTSWSPTQTEIKVKAPVGSEDNGNITVDRGFETATSSQTYEVQSPHIAWISPNRGGVGQYVTIKGENFGGSPGKVWFRRWDGGGSTDIEGVFPPIAQCDSTWWDNKIIITVPDGFNIDDLLRLQIERADGKWSNQKDFTLTGDPPGPGLCKIVPECGSAGNTVDLYGEKFGDGTDALSFVDFNEFQAAGYPAPGWSDQHIPAASSVSLANNNYNIRVFNSSGMSNPMPYDIPCGDAPYIINDATCDPDTDVWPSPAPRPNAINVCKNAIVTARFGPANKCIGGADAGEDCAVGLDCDSGQCGIQMAGGTINATNIVLEKCNAGASFDSITCAPSGGTVNFYAPNKFTLIPSAALEASTWYQVTVKKEVETIAEARMNSDYQWHFMIKEDGSDCPVAYVQLADNGPDPVGEINYFNPADGPNIENYNATPYSADCTPLTAAGYSFIWSSSKSTVASVGAVTTENNQATAVTNGYTWIKVEVEDKSDRERLTVNYCNASSDCTDYDGDPATGPECPDSICDIAAHKCTPDVTGFTPPDGRAGTCVTIAGCYFGGSTGTVKYQDNVRASSIRCVDQNWLDNQIVSEVPEEAIDGKITVRKTDGLEAQSDTDFDVNDTIHPCLCRLQPVSGEVHNKIDFYGYGFSSASANQKAYFSPNIEAASYGSWTDTKLDNAEVPVGTTTGPASTKVTIDGVDSNTIDFTFDPGWGVACNSSPDPLICTPNNALCPAGYYCDTTACVCQAGTGPVGGACDGNTSTPLICEANDDLCNPDAYCSEADSCTCQWNDFTLGTILPLENGETCTSAMITMEFSQNVDAASATEKEAGQFKNIYLKQGADYIEGNIYVYGTKVVFSPNNALAELSHTMEVTGDLKSVHGQSLSNPKIWNFIVKGPCSLDNVSISLLKTDNGFKRTYSPPDIFTCNLDKGCRDDYDTGPDGNQHGLLAVGYDGGNPVKAEFTIPVVNLSTDDVVEVNDPSPADASTSTQLWAYLDPKAGDDIGIAQLDFSANDALWAPAGLATTIDKSFIVRVFICDFPWPAAPKPFPFQDNEYNFLTYYCMDGGLPDFSKVVPITPIPGIDNLMKEYLLTKAEGQDVIGIRIMKNLEHLSPAEWYRKTFGNEAGHPYSTEIAGNEAVKDGRTIYVNAANKAGDGNFYTNMYIISYDEEQSACNMAKNSSFESGRDNWTTEGTVDSVNGVGEQVDDTWSVKLTSDNSLSGIYQEFANLEINKNYTVSGWVKAEFAGDANKGRVGLITQCWGKRCIGGDKDGKKCKIDVDCPGGGCSSDEGEVKDTECGFYQANYNYPANQLINDEANGGLNGRLPWTKVTFNVKYDSPNYKLRVGCINSTEPPGSGTGYAWCDFIQVEPTGSCTGSLTRNVYSQIIDNLAFNTNPEFTLDDVTLIQRDVKRLGHLTYVNNYLVDYKNKNGNYPDLEAGSYLRNMSTSFWPSWQARLGNVLGKSLPIDPLDRDGLCAPPYHPDTCWDEENKKFMCTSPDAYPYAYIYNNNAGIVTVKLFGHLEYMAADWQCPVNSISGNICPDPDDCTCSCFNKEIIVGQLCL